MRLTRDAAIIDTLKNVFRPSPIPYPSSSTYATNVSKFTAFTDNFAIMHIELQPWTLNRARFLAFNSKLTAKAAR